MRHVYKRLRVPVTLAVATTLAIPLGLPAQAEEPKPPKDAASGWSKDTVSGKVKSKPGEITPKDRAKVLGEDYKTSKDTAFTTSGDGTGFHLLVADERDGYHWKTAATLREEGFEAGTWIGNACVTASGKYAAVAYAPRTFTNKPELMVRGAFTALVNLDSGKVTKLDHQASLAYFSPGCGNGEQVVFTQLSHDGDKQQKTRLITVDATTGKAAAPVAFPGQVTSAVPVKDGIVAAHGNQLVKINGAKEKVLARTTAVPFQISANADGGVTFIDRERDRTVKDTPTSWAKHLPAGKVKAGKKTKPLTTAEGKLEAWDLARTPGGKVFITGSAKTKAFAEHVNNPGGLAMGARISSLGHAAVTTTWADGKSSLITPSEARATRDARTQVKILATGKTVTLDARPDADGKNAATGTTRSPALPEPAVTGKDTSPQGGVSSKPVDSGGMSTQTMRTQALTGVGDNPSESASERYCSVPRNDVKLQAFQPTPRQVEWAVDQAVVGELNLTRPSNWKNTGIGGYSPQGFFPAPVLAGDPNGTLDNEDSAETDKWHIPAQVMLGITAQESNMWQATRFAVPGVTANSLIGNYYGVDYASSGEQLDAWRINWADADCGYGITQATDGMRLLGKTKPGETALPELAQKSVALDYTANIAAGVQILSEKWNQTYKAGMKINGGHPKWIENWFFALWAYNSGFYPTADSAGHWGVGFTNNPANPLWKANRTPFLESASGADDYSHAAHPQDWPYQEKVIGWAARPISAMFAPGDFQAGYRPAWWNSTAYRTTAKPPVDLFCTESNFCDPSRISDTDSNDPGQGACMIDGDDTDPHWLHCWWNEEITETQWKNCDTLAECGNAVHRFNTSYGEQADAGSYPPNCTKTGLPSNALVIDDLPDGTVPAGSDSNRGCGAVSSDGTFKFTFVPWDTQMDLTNDGVDNPTTVTTYPGKIDTHQIGAAYGNHFWFTHTRSPEGYPGNANRLKVTGTWTLGQKITTHNGQAKVFAHIPDHGAQTKEATYRITTADGVREAKISQTANASNKWVDLGAYFFGDVIPTVELDNFNGGTGDADIAFDAIAFAPGEWNGMKLADVPAPDPNAPAPAPVTPPDTIDGRFFSVGLTGSSTTSTQTMSAQTAAASDADVLSCSSLTLSMKYTRTDACIIDEIFIKKPADSQSGAKEAKFRYIHEIHTDPKSKTTTQEMYISLQSLTGATKTSFDVKSMCRGNCVMGAKNTNGTSSTFTKGDGHVYHITQTIDWNGTGSDIIVPHWEYNGTLDGLPTKSTPTAEKDNLTIRCDNTVPNAGTGCVFSWYDPTYVMNSKMYPDAASHIRMMWDKTKITWGNRAGGKPLKYLGRKVADDGTGKLQKDRNRTKICVNSWKTYPGTRVYTSLIGKTDPKSCDEFAFANSYQSGGTPTSNGGTNPVTKNGSECIQTYIKENADGTSSLRLRPDYPQPTWNEPCGRSSMSNWQNTGSMGLNFAAFIRQQRLQQDDEYWVDLDGM